MATALLPPLQTNARRTALEAGRASVAHVDRSECSFAAAAHKMKTVNDERGSRTTFYGWKRHRCWVPCRQGLVYCTAGASAMV